jgi:hypothetical protein
MKPTSALAFAFVLLALVAASAGCASDDAQQEPPTPISAREALAEARPLVDEWDPDAELLVLSGFEGGEESPAVQRQAQEDEHDVQNGFRAHEDPLPGDGRAPQWVMVFLSGEETRTVRADSNGAEWMDNGSQPAGPGAQPVGSFSLDSTNATQAALDADNRLDELLAARDVSVFLTLSGDGEGAQWQIQASSHSVGTQEIVFVDVETGEVRNRSDVQRSQRSQSFAGTISAANDTATHAVEARSDGARLAVELAWNGSESGEGTRLSAALVADNGTQIEPDERQHTAEGFQASWYGIEDGDYEVEVQAERFEQARDYELAVHLAD